MPTRKNWRLAIGCCNSCLTASGYMYRRSIDFGGHDWDIARYTYYDASNPANSYRPRQNQPGFFSTGVYDYTTPAGFGSAHASGFNMAFCDGSVCSISYNINLQIHSYRGNRHEGQPIDGSKY